jgi:hypothetical protein
MSDESPAESQALPTQQTKAEVLLIQAAEEKQEYHEMHCTKPRSNRTEKRYAQER